MCPYILFIFIAMCYFIVRINTDYFILGLFPHSNTWDLFDIKNKTYNLLIFLIHGYGARSGNLNFKRSTTDNYEEDELQNTLYEKILIMKPSL